MTVAPYSKNDNRLYVQGSAVIFFFYLRFSIEIYASTMIKTVSAIIASVVIISSAKVLVKIHRHQLLSLYCERSKKRYYSFH